MGSITILHCKQWVAVIRIVLCKNDDGLESNVMLLVAMTEAMAKNIEGLDARIEVFLCCYYGIRLWPCQLFCCLICGRFRTRFCEK